MKVDCYDACGCPVIEILVGDTFYYKGNLYIRVDGIPRIDTKCDDKVWAVDLAKGGVTWFEHDCIVTYADCKIVANTKEIE